MAEDRVLMCVRVTDMDTPIMSRIGACHGCGTAVWIADSSPPHDRCLCFACVEIEMKTAADVELAPPTAEQLAEVKNYYRRRR
jgi:hypothetical protein